MAAPPLRIAACQLHATAGAIAANLGNLRSVLRALRDAAHGPVNEDSSDDADSSTCAVDLVVLPETFLQGYHIGPTLMRRLAVTVPPQLSGQRRVEPQPSHANPTELHVDTKPNPLTTVSALAREFGVAIALPFAERGVLPDPLNPTPESSPVYNSVAVFDSDGALVKLYRKTHLWGAHYEKRLFTPGPGPEAAGGAPFTPFTLRRFPHLPIGVLICFDLEFPEPCRALALRGAKVILCSLASGDPHGFTSRKTAPCRACENDGALAFVNYPSSGVRRGGETPVAPDCKEVSYAGGSSVFGPDGSAIVQLPAFPLQPGRACPTEWPHVISGPGHDAAASAAVTSALRHAGVLDDAGRDECVLIVTFDPRLPRYEEYRNRNRYLLDRRTDLY